jgi:hypothetical protein
MKIASIAPAVCLSAAVLGLTAAAPAVNVLVISADNPTLDSAVVAALEAGGHTVTLGPDFSNFTEQTSLDGIDVVYLQSNSNFSNPDMSQAGQQALLDFVDAGGGLVTCEWAEWKAYSQGQFQVLRSALPGLYSTFNYDASEMLTEVTPDATLNKGLPDSFEMSLDSYGGTQSKLTPKCGAAEYYRSNYASGVLGWNFGIGRVLSFSTTNGPTQVADPEFGKLFSNAMKWASLAGGPPPDPAYADCDKDGALSLFDFLCFTNEFNAGEDNADCDGSGDLSLFDFLCFVNAFNAGC